MASISNANLTVTTVNEQVTLLVTYDATFNEFERQLSGLGKTWHTHVAVHDFDGGDSVGAVLVELPRDELPVTVGTGEQPLTNRTVDVTVPRSALQGDPGTNSDELKARIRIHSPEVLPEFTDEVFSDQEILLG